MRVLFNVTPLQYLGNYSSNPRKATLTMVKSKLNRTIKFFELQAVDNDGKEIINVADRVFSHVHHSCQQVTLGYQDIRRNGIDYRGWSGSTQVTQEDFLLIGKRRLPVDNPGVDRGDKLPSPLELEAGGQLVEPAYVVPVLGTPYIAVLGTSNCPRSGALAEWMTVVGGYRDKDLEIHLTPVLRQDAREKLRHAKGALGFTVKIPVNASKSIHGRLGDAFRAAEGFAGGDGSLLFEFSLGRHKKGRDSETLLLNEISKVADIPETEQAKARLRIDDHNGTTTHIVDFIQDKLTARTTIVCDNEVPLSHDTAVSELKSAISQNREHLRN